MKIIVPIAGEIYFSDQEFAFPKPLIDINNKPIIEYVINNLSEIADVNGYIFILKQELSTKFNLDSTIKLLTNNPDIILLKNPTKGSVCSVLMAIDIIPLDEEIIIVNSDQLFFTDLNLAITSFRSQNATAGVITFESVHPRWSFVQLENDSNVVLQAAEKKAISKNAIAGFYYFKSFSDFLSASFKSITNQDTYNDQIYISAVVNQLILMHKKVINYKINNSEYITFYTPQKIAEFEQFILNKKV